jgi:exonuclease III
MLSWTAWVAASSHKLIQHDMWHRLRQYDIISISGASASTPAILQQHFPTHTVLDLPCGTPCQKGCNTLVKFQLAQYTCIEVRHPNVSCMWLRIKAAATHLSKDLLVATCYIPAEGSRQVRQMPLDYRSFQRRLQHSVLLSQSGHLLVCGDFNARVAQLDPTLHPSPPALLPGHACKHCWPPLH